MSGPRTNASSATSPLTLDLSGRLRLAVVDCAAAILVAHHHSVCRYQLGRRHHLPHAVLVKLAFFQLSAAGYKSMARMRKVQPRMAAIKEEYANDKAKQSQAMMELYKKEKINPLGGCLPILVQMPVFIALYWVLMESVELRQAPFALWITDLSVMDPYFVLPILMGASMYYMQKLNPAPPDPMQAKIMQWMPIVFTFFFLWFPAGLVLYWLCNNLLSMGQQYVINRSIDRGAL